MEIRAALLGFIGACVAWGPAPLLADEKILRLETANFCQRSEDEITMRLMKFPGVRAAAFIEENPRLQIIYDDGLADAHTLKIATEFLAGVTSKPGGPPV